MKITNTSEMSVQELKRLADEKGITYQKNATAAQMQELLSKWEEALKTMLEPQSSNNNSTPSNGVDLSALLAEMKEMRALINATTDVNKRKDFEKQLVELNNFSYSIKLLNIDWYDCPVTSWKTITNRVFLEEDKTKVWAEQIIEVTYLKEDGSEWTKKMDLVDFSRFLTRSDKLTATKIKNLDGSDVYVSKEMNPETKKEYYIMRPKSSDINVTLNMNWKEITILSTYLNA